MSSKSKLSGLVVKKKPVKLPQFSVAKSAELITNDSNLTITSSVTQSNSAETCSDNAVSLGVNGKSDIDGKQITNGEATTNCTSKIGTESQKTNLGGLGMLGAYSDSESDTSE